MTTRVNSPACSDGARSPVHSLGWQSSAGTGLSPSPPGLPETVAERFGRCGVSITQHIDIYGRFQGSHVQQNRRFHAPRCIGAISSASSSSSRKTGSSSDDSVSSLQSRGERLERLSTTTRVSSLYPGHDILGRKGRFRLSSLRPASSPFLGWR